MYNIDYKIKQQYHNFRNGKEIFRDEDGVIDLASIMVGVIVIGLIGGVIAATVFAVIPWTQDNAAKQQLDSIVQAENAYFGLSAAVPSPLPTGYKTNSFGKSAELEAANLLKSGQRYCVTTPDDSKTYIGFSQSNSGSVWSVTDKDTKPVLYTGTLPTDCVFITEGVEGVVVPQPVETPYIDPTPTITKLTYKCDTTTSSYLPMTNQLKGTVTWSDNTVWNFGSGGVSGTTPTKTLTGGKEYTVVWDGSFQNMTYNGLTKCLRSVDHLGSTAGVTSAQRAFEGATNLTSLPDNIPTTITRMDSMFKGATSLNDDSLKNWDVSNVTNMTSMFEGATSFNQSLNNWNVSKVTTMQSMFSNASNFNQPLNNWKVDNTVDMSMMFSGANAFNQDLGSWNTDNVKSMAFMFGEPLPMKNNIRYANLNTAVVLKYKCDISTSSYLPMTNQLQGVVTWSDNTVWNFGSSGATGTTPTKALTGGQEYAVVMEGSFQNMTYNGLTKCLRSVDYWGGSTGVSSAQRAFEGATNLTSLPDSIPTTITRMDSMLKGATSFNDNNIKNWDVSNVTNMTSMFEGATNFNQPLNSWNVSKVTRMQSMFFDSSNFNQPLNNWNVSNTVDMIMMFSGANAFNQDLGSWNMANVKSMAFMFGEPLTMKNNVQHVTYNNTVVMNYKCDITTSGYLPMNNQHKGSYTWDDRTLWDYGYNVTGVSGTTPNKALTGGQDYTVVLEGSYQNMSYSSLTRCLRSIDHWGSATGVTSAQRAFEGATNLTSLPDSIPTTITRMDSMFKGATSFNDDSLKNWDVSKVTNMSSMFSDATAFSQDLSKWSTSAVTAGTLFAPASFPDAYLPARTSK